MAENFAAVIHGPNDVRIEKWPMPQMNEDEVLIKMSCVGICGSDVKIYTTGRCGHDVITEPFVMGHEGAGTVVKVGENVTNLKVGHRVAIEPTQPCRRCEYCKQGRYNLCVKPHYCSSMGAPGNLCHYYTHVADFCHKIPENLSMEEGAAVQPLAIAMHACNRAGIRVGANIAILGGGPIGVLCAMTAKAMGASKILITDVVQSRLDTAKQLAADHTLLLKKDSSDEEVVDQIVGALGCRPDVTFDACGYASAQRIAMLVTKTAGVVLVVGIADAVVEVPLSQALLREVDIRGSYRIVNTYPAALAAVSSGAIALKSFITHHFNIQHTREALALAHSGDAMKIIIHVDK
ncbi:sorbitol dehydrogenase-like [Pectinophora gossypiella]|uniref:sorbitol dehydrogenase-like n=1 Tax=Pectinophora gossypiella TaxID=13191 RepID=UPI00214EEC6E|nr:sorbitol dehydrogenase-like [Pectinophora gossypiella]